MSLGRELSSSSSSEEDQSNQEPTNQEPRQEEERNGLEPLFLLLLLRDLIRGLNNDGLTVEAHVGSPAGTPFGIFRPTPETSKFNYSFNDDVTLEVKKHPQPNNKHYHLYIENKDRKVDNVLNKEEYLSLKGAIQSNNQQEIVNAIRNIDLELIEKFKLDTLSNRPNLVS